MSSYYLDFLYKVNKGLHLNQDTNNRKLYFGIIFHNSEKMLYGLLEEV